MMLKGELLDKHLAAGLRSVYVLYGDEPLLVLEAADSIRRAAKKADFAERQILTAQVGFDWQELRMALGNLSLFGDKRLLDLRIPNGKPGREGSAVLQEVAQQELVDTLLLITLPDLDWRDEKAAWLLALEKSGVLIKLQAPKLNDLPMWLAARLFRQQQSAPREALVFLAERVEGNLLAAHQEIQKLALMYPAGALTLEDVRTAVLNVGRHDLDHLREALLNRDTPRLLRVINGLLQEGEAPPLIIWALAEDIRALLALRCALDANESSERVMRQYNLRGARQNSIKRAAQFWSQQALKKALARVAQLDRLAKGAEKISAQGSLRENLLQLALGLL